MEPLSTAGRLAAMVGRPVVRPCRARVDRSRPTETPGCAGSGLAPGAAKPRRGGHISARAGATPRCHGRNPRSIKARSRARVGIGDAAAMGGVMHQRCPRRRRGRRRRARSGRDRPRCRDAPNPPSPNPITARKTPVLSAVQSRSRILAHRRTRPGPERSKADRPENATLHTRKGCRPVRRPPAVRPAGFANGLAAGLDYAAALPGLLEVACRHRLTAQALHRGHHVGLLREEGVAELLGPLQVVAHILQNPRERHQRLDAGVPALRLQRVGQRIAGQFLVGGFLTQRAASTTSSG